ncbi:hypothetical protein HYN56_19805 [Flavobacterium crocinum]|uniref:Serine aminopeptidase S33 domain-containing protein n=1 Tax=Flavobacterium crocinum TaxID=2183896 RepID=A0A2S1YQK2_9FLAO|nr:alpha/beta hydrolase [Flavobacterium crocinum]AWK06349.1 hypothetical protein HYN56_19805 [Flavobacterium crocinum]
MIKHFIFFFCLSVMSYSQESLQYEKELENQQNYNHYDISAIQENENFILRGSLITPKNSFEKVVVIVPGSGKDTRNNHFILAEGLLKNNLAVFRYDERGLGESEGVFSNVRNGITSKSWDLYFLIKSLKQTAILKNKKIILLGHSEGGMISVGALEKGATVDYLLQWAVPIFPRGAIFKYQIKTGVNKQERNLQYPDENTKYAAIDSIDKIVGQHSSLSNPDLKKIIIKSMKESGFKEKQFGWYISLPVYMDILRIDSRPFYKNISLPMLYVIGSEDRNVDPVGNVELLKSFKNNNIQMKVFDGLNHYLNNQELGVPDQSMYKINDEAEKYIINWILSQK